MEKIIVEVIGAKASEFLVQIFIQILALLHEILRKLRCQDDLVAQTVLLHDTSDGIFTAGINICRIPIRHTQLDRTEELRFRLLEVDAPAFRGKPHAPEA